MKPEFTTERLTLKPVGAEDFEIFYKILTDPFVRRYLCDDEILPPETVREFIAESERNFARARYGLWLARQNAPGDPIGFAGLKNFFDEPQPQLLYALLPEFTRQGFACEASRKIIEYAFTKLNFAYLDAAGDAPNGASHRVAERLGMKKIGETEENGAATIFFRLENKK